MDTTEGTWHGASREWGQKVAPRVEREGVGGRSLSQRPDPATREGVGEKPLTEARFGHTGRSGGEASHRGQVQPHGKERGKRPLTEARFSHTGRSRGRSLSQRSDSATRDRNDGGWPPPPRWELTPWSRSTVQISGRAFLSTSWTSKAWKPAARNQGLHGTTRDPGRGRSLADSSSREMEGARGKTALHCP